MKENKKYIGVFDSGLGGLTVLKELKKSMPNESFIYFGDTAHLPYGNKSKASVIQYSLNIANFLFAQQVKAMVVACNTASSVALETLNKKYSIPVFEYSAKKVKQSLTGNGNAHKSQLQFMVMQDLSLKNFNGPSDASDALAIALCHLNQVKVNEL